MERRPYRVLVAPDKFKGTLTAAQARDAIAAGLRRVHDDVVVTSVPLADGGEGTIDALLDTGATSLAVDVDGPLEGMTVTARVAVQGTTAFVESAQACGLQLIEPTARTSLAAHSRGVGQMIRAALDAGCEQVVVGLGGVACTDGGAGMAQALGAALLRADGTPVAPGGAGLADLARVSPDGLDTRTSSAAVVAACDVRNPLVGPEGAAHVYGPQKGAGPGEVSALDANLRTYARVLARDLGVEVADLPGAGAAGGLAGGLAAFLGAEITSGAELVLHLLGFDAAVAETDLVITGEGSLDTQSLHGKAPVTVAELAAAAGVPTIALAGVVDLDGRATPFADVRSLVDHAGPERALRDTAATLAELSADAFATWLRRRPEAGSAPPDTGPVRGTADEEDPT